jgi:hypothetical protein
MGVAFGSEQAFPHAPQLCTLLVMSTSHPFAATRSQSPKPASHAATPQAPPAHMGVAFGVTHALPQKPQLCASEAMFTSQPFAAAPSQSPKPAKQPYVHAPIAQTPAAFGGEVHALSQAPQWMGEACVFTSQPFAACPSQFPKPASQNSTTHVPAEHPGVPFGVAHTTPQPPQFWTSALVGSSQPLLASLSQSLKPAEHMNEHIPAEHAGSAFTGAEQALSHAPQFVAEVSRLASQPSITTPLQSSNPASHAAIPHTPAEHSGVAFGVWHAAPQPPQFWTSALVGCSQPVLASPSQSSNPASHTSEHAPAAHTAVPFGPLGQTLSQAPQCKVEVSTLASHPFAAWLSQSSKPASHAPMPQLICSQAPDAFAGSHASPQKAQSVSVPRTVSQPFEVSLSQLAVPAAHTSSHVPVTHDSPGGHASPQLPQFFGSSAKTASQPFVTSPSQSVKPA